jgi:hypothetical protein
MRMGCNFPVIYNVCFPTILTGSSAEPRENLQSVQATKNPAQWPGFHH